MKIKQQELKSNGQFALFSFDETKINVLNLYTGKICHKKIYENKKGRYFMHSTPYGRIERPASVHYLKDFNQKIVYIPYQIINKL